MAYVPTPFTTTASINASTKFSQYPTEIIKLMSDVGTYLVAQLTAMGAQLSTNTGYSAAVLDQGDHVSRASKILTGGGTITVSATWSVLWSARFITMGNGRGALSATAGFFDIICPTTGTITGLGGATNKTATAAGIPLDAWDTLYYILPLGAASTSVAANFRVVGYTVDYAIPNTWIKIAYRNGDGNYVEFANDVSLRPNTSINSNLFDVLGADVSGAVGSANTLATARTINGVSFNGSANINIEDRLGTAIASAATTTVGTSGLGEYIHITGTTTITSLGTASAAGIRRTLIFDGALTLTHNATSLICVGGANIVTVAGTVIEVVSETTANWRVISVTHPSLSFAELSYLDGVAGNIQTQINAKANLVSPALTGTGSITGGMSFGNTAQAGATVLDWYEEGTFTPVVAGATTAGAGTYTTQLGRFTRIGNCVFFTINITTTAHTGTGQMLITGLPYISEATAGNSGSANVGYISLLTYAAIPKALIAPSTSQISLWTAATAAAAVALPMDVANTITINGVYQV
jgi:hypothetical protein